MLDIFGQYATLIGQLLSVIAIVTLLIQLGKWWITKRGSRTSETRVYFVLLLIAIIATNIFSMLRSLNEIDQLQSIDALNIKLNVQQLKSQNLTLQNQQLINEVLNATKSLTTEKNRYVPTN